MKEALNRSPAASLRVGETLAASIACAGILSLELTRRGTHPGWVVLIGLWLLSIGLAGVAAAALSSDGSPASGARASDVLTALAILIIALVVRWVGLDKFPYAMSGDEGSQAMEAVAVLNGKLPNPFSTGWYSVPTLFFFTQAGSIALFGDSVGGVRTVSTLVGAATVAGTYLLVRRLADRWTAIAAASILAVYHHHLHMSRLASVQIYDPFFAVLLLLLIDRSLEEERPLDWFACGVVLAASQYFHFGARVLPLVWLVSVAHAIWTRRVAGSESRLAWLRRRGARLISWTAVGAGLTYLPLWIHYLAHPAEANSRVRQVVIFASGWLAREQHQAGASAAIVLLRQISKSALLPFLTPPAGWYRGPGVPFAGWPIVPFLAIGMLAVTVRCWRSRLFPLAVLYWGSVIGLGLTDAPATQRATITTPMIAFFTAAGLAALRRALLRLPGRIGRPIALATSAAVGVIVAWNVWFYFHSPEDIARYADGKTLAATELARYLRAEAPRHSVYFAGMPHMRYEGFQSLRFIARDAKGVDVETPWTKDTLPPALPGPSVFAFLPWRAGELSIIRSRFPGGRLRQYLWVDGSLLLIVYDVPAGRNAATADPLRAIPEPDGLSSRVPPPAARPGPGGSAPIG